MLKIKSNKKRLSVSTFIGVFAAALILGGAYLLSLVAAPTVAPFIAMKPIDVKALPMPKQADDRIVIPKIGVNIVYAPGAETLDRGAQWRWPERGNPETGGNFIIAAHRFSIQPTPQGTVEKSPFYNIDKLILGDKIVIDYKGQRYGYEITKIFDVKPTQIEIEAATAEHRLTLYSCELGGADAGRVVIYAKPLGIVALNQANT